jgi:hypothetical protein
MGTTAYGVTVLTGPNRLHHLPHGVDLPHGPFKAYHFPYGLDSNPSPSAWSMQGVSLSL